MFCIILTNSCYAEKLHFKKMFVVENNPSYYCTDQLYPVYSCYAVGLQNFSIFTKLISIPFKKQVVLFPLSPATGVHHFTLMFYIYLMTLGTTCVWNSKAFVCVMGLYHWHIVLKFQPCRFM